MDASSPATYTTTSKVENVPAESSNEAKAKEAFNDETGEINWDCPCLEGMTKPPCGEAFKAAFSCFVYSKEEPKGVDCLEAFSAMQECFRNHPEIYDPELSNDAGEDEDEDDDEDDDGDANIKRNANETRDAPPANP
ncbi:Oxidoreductase [Phlyctochytrium planicorne]|nr:Oxidoreductase [Phlyctochytrium planicorne]